MGEVPETPEEKKEVTLSLSYKEAAAFHLCYFLGALVLNQEYERVPEHARCALDFANQKLTDDEIVSVRQKATSLIEQIPDHVRKELGLIKQVER